MSTPDLIPFPPGLEAFCASPDAPRAVLREPFRIANVAYATDGKVLALVDSPGPDTVEAAKYSAFLAIAGEALVHNMRTVDEFLERPVSYPCRECDGDKTVDLDCLTCDGNGYHECKCGHEHDCAECDGEGTDGTRGTKPCPVCLGKGEQYHRNLRGSSEHLIHGCYLDLIFQPEHGDVRFCPLSKERAAFSFWRDGVLWRGLVAYARKPKP